MSKFLLSIFLLISISTLAQTKLTVLDGFMEDQPLNDVWIVTPENQKLGKTDANGYFLIPAEYKTVDLILEGYEAKRIYAYGRDLTVLLQPITVELVSAEIVNTDAEARKFIRQVISHQKSNRIENLKSYQYKSYSKFLITINKDSMPYIMMPKNKIDSSYNDMRKLIDESHLMLGERAMDHKYSSKYGEKSIVKASRISGIKTPMYEFMVMQPISHNFDDQKIDFFFRQFINPVSKSGLQEYRYRIVEEETLENRKMIVIAFFPTKRIPNKPQIKGRIWIDLEKKAIGKFYAENLSDKSIAELELDWTYINGYWFPRYQKYRMDGGRMSYPSVKDSISPDGKVILDTIQKKEKVWLHLTTSFKDVITPKDFDPKEFKGYTNEIDLNSLERMEETFDAYRDNALTTQEANTYVKIDSIGSKYNLDGKIQLLRVISSGGKLPLGKFDWDLTKLMSYNDYEGFRLGLGGNTNFKFNENFSLNGYVAYGFKDEAFKYGVGADWFVNKPYAGKLFASYTDDVAASGKNPILLQNNYLKFIYGNLNNLYNDYFYSYKKATLGYQQDMLQNVTFHLSANYIERKPEFEYFYQNNPLDKTYNSFETQLALRWAPKDQNVMTPYGKVTIKSGMPMFYLTVTKAWDLFDTEYTPTKLEFSYLDNYRTFFGLTNVQAHAGMLFGDAPIMQSFDGNGNSKNGNTVFKRFGVAGISNFETMRPGEFYSDKFMSFHIAHKFAGFKFLKKEIFPEFIYRGMIGDFKNSQDHHLIAFNTAKNYYQEAGVELNQLFMGMIGVGAYYRMGAYSYDAFDQNLFVKLTLRFQFF